MKQQTKIQFLPFEMEMLCNADLLLTKNVILQKIKDLLTSVEEKQKAILGSYPWALPPEVQQISSKISRGENYRGLPWLVLDHPRYFVQQQVFAIRTMFWWGKFFSCTLHLSGQYKEQIQQKIENKKEDLDLHSFYLCIHDSQWEHHFDPENYQLIREMPKDQLATLLQQKSFLKLAVKIPLLQMDDMENLLCKNYERILLLLA